MRYLRSAFFLGLLLIVGCKKENIEPVQELTLSAAFQNHMVLQREVEVPIFGNTGSNVKVEVKIGEDIYSTESETNGEWQILISPREAGGPHEIEIKAGDKIVVLSDIYFGDVWLCSGQSNMKMRLKETEYGDEETMNADLPFLRHFEAKGYGRQEPQTDWPEGEWEICTPETAADFTGAGYYFAKFIHPEINVPIGLLNTTWSSTRIEEWMSVESFTGNVPPPPSSLDWDADWDGNKNPHRFFNQYINPMTRMPIKGVLWYQGESNAKLEFATEYELQFKALIKDWRERWGQPELPFIFVQLSSWEPNNGVNRWAELRASQTAALEIPNTAMVLTYDISPDFDIHPPNKKDLGYRLALAARRLVYGHDVIASGPVFESAIWDSINGHAVLRFSSKGNGLTEQPVGAELKGFEMIGADGIYLEAQALVSNNEVFVYPAFSENPVAVRYAWKNAPLEANLFNMENLPAIPFSYEF